MACLLYLGLLLSPIFLEIALKGLSRVYANARKAQCLKDIARLEELCRLHLVPFVGCTPEQRQSIRDCWWRYHDELNTEQERLNEIQSELDVVWWY